MSEPGSVTRGLFVAVGVFEYSDEQWPPLKAAQAAMGRLVEIMSGGGYDVVALTDPGYAQVTAGLDAAGWKERGFRGPLVLAWAGHGEHIEDELALVVSDTPSRSGVGMRHRPRDLARFARSAGSRDTLVVLDSCSSGAGDADILVAAIRADNETSHAGAAPQLGVLVSSKAYEPALDGALLSALVDLLESGPADEAEAGIYAPLWSSSYENVPVAAVAYALSRRRIGQQSPRSWFSGGSSICLPNLGHISHQPAALVADRLEPLGISTAHETVVMTPAIDALRARIDSGRSGLWLVIGSAGTGKSTCLAAAAGAASHHATVVSARLGLAAARDALTSESPSAVMVDGLDEAPLRDLDAILEASIRASRRRFVVIATRPDALEAVRPGPAGRGLIGAEDVIELDLAPWMSSAIASFVVQRLKDAG